MKLLKKSGKVFCWDKEYQNDLLAGLKRDLEAERVEYIPKFQ